jgi:hypothetical protein
MPCRLAPFKYARRKEIMNEYEFRLPSIKEAVLRIDNLFKIYGFVPNCPASQDWITTKLAIKTAAQTVGSQADTATNKQMAMALWNELSRKCPVKVPEKTDWVSVTQKRLNSALKAITKA